MITKITSLIAILFIMVTTANGQQKAITENGDAVFLYEDGTWEYELKENREAYEIPTNPKKFKVDNNYNFQLKSNTLNIGFWIDPKIWSFNKAENNEDAEYELQLKEGDLYATIITEKVEIPLTTLKGIAIENAKKLAPDVRVVKEEYRTVNDLKVLLLQVNGTMQGIKFTYYGYYYSDGNGTVQFITYTAQNLLNEYMPHAEKLLNGLSLIKE